ncbi:MAG: GNAT family N-acetyltransferase [Gemmatimonadales bacterium]
MPDHRHPPPPTFLAALLPDLPRWVEVRGMLLSGHGFSVGVTIGPPPAFVALEPDGLAVVVGHPPDDIIRAAAARTREVLAAPEDADRVAAALPGWKRERATIHILDSDERLPAVPAGAVRELPIQELAAVPDPALREELLSEAGDGTRIVAAYAGEVPVAFCYAGSVTERWWDISIDTLEPYRRRGYAARCVAFRIRELALLGKRPVWGAVESNPGSMGLAVKLGFRPVDTLFLFSP